MLAAVPEPAAAQTLGSELALPAPERDAVPRDWFKPQEKKNLPCPDCNPPKRFWAGFGELMAVQFIPWGYTKWVTEGEWSNISFRTWADNLKFPWQWDNNKFNNNQFAHPYHGSLYRSEERRVGKECRSRDPAYD